MGNKFKLDKTRQGLIFGYNIEDFLPPGHIARLIEEIVKAIDTSKLEEDYSELGQKSYDPKILIKIIFYGNCIGVFSSRKLMRGCQQDLAFMYLSKLYKPDHRTISDFRKKYIKELGGHFKDVLKYCEKLGLKTAGRIAIDGSKIKASASNDRMKTIEGYDRWEERLKKEMEELIKKGIDIDEEEDRRLREKSEEEIPKELRKREKLIKKIRDIKDELKKEMSQREGSEDLKKNITDPDARYMKESQGGVRMNYNAQIATTEDQLIAGSEVSTNAGDRKELIAMIEEVERNTDGKVKEVYADAGYSSLENYKEIGERKIDAYIPDQRFEKSKKDKRAGGQVLTCNLRKSSSSLKQK